MTTLKAMLDAYAKATEKIWQHDRLSTLGASSTFTCLRKSWFAQNETAHDADYDDGYGGRKRGDIIEAHWVVPALRAGMPPGCELLWAGEDQRTIVDGYSSATPDGLIVNRSNQDVTIEGFVLAPNDCIGVEIKSIDPRIDLQEEKAEHHGQTQMQMGLIRDCTEYTPEIVLVLYVDASFFDDVSVFPVKFDPSIYAAGRQRAKAVMTSESALEFPPEGKIAGGKECKYCPYQGRCIGATIQAIPRDEAPLSGEAVAVGAALAAEERRADAAKKVADAEHAAVQDQVKTFLRDNKTRKVKGDGWSMSWFPVKGRKTLNQDAAEADGIDLSLYMVEGNPHDRLTVKINNQD